jgi:hypothetical protein
VTSPELDDDHVVAICRVLQAHDVAFVIIGGIAARLHDTGHATVDVDICPSRDETNLENLAAALRDLGTRLRVEGDPDGVTFDPHPDMLRRVSTMTLITAHGPLDPASPLLASLTAIPRSTGTRWSSRSRTPACPSRQSTTSSPPNALPAVPRHRRPPGPRGAPPPVSTDQTHRLTRREPG